MLKYKKNSQISEPYIAPATTNYKYKMDLGEWGFEIHKSVQDVINNFGTVYKYSVIDKNYIELIKEIKKYNGLQDNENNNILLTNGSDNALRLILELFATDDSTILVPTPTYVNFEHMLKTHTIKKCENVYIDYKLTDKEAYNLLVEKLNDDQYDVCYIINPSMPIGHMLTKENIITILSTHKNTLFIIDEAYIEFSDESSLSPLIEEFDNIIIVRTFSKFFSLAALRIGYMISNPKIIKLIKPNYNYRDVTEMSVCCALQSLKHLDFYEQHKKTYLEMKKYVIYRMENIVKKFSGKKITDFIMKNGVYFTIICEDPVKLKEYLDSNDVAVRNKSSDIKGAIRITIANEEHMSYLFDLLENF